MTHSADVRDYCVRHYIEPARVKGEKLIAIRTGDVHEAMGYQNRLPLVCGAIGAEIFSRTNNLSRTSIDGPVNGANTIYRFELLA
jgi:hypothetical protein